jgi:hypothetical protein
MVYRWRVFRILAAILLYVAPIMAEPDTPDEIAKGEHAGD